MWLLEASINKVIKQSFTPGPFNELKHHTIQHSENDENPSDNAAQVDQEFAKLIVLASDLHGERWEFKGHFDLLASDLRVLFLVLGEWVGPGLVVSFVAGLGCVYKDMGHKFEELKVVVELLRFLLFYLTNDVLVKIFFSEVELEVVGVVFESCFNLLQVLGLLSVELEFLKVMLQIKLVRKFRITAGLQ